MFKFKVFRKVGMITPAGDPDMSLKAQEKVKVAFEFKFYVLSYCCS